MHKHEFGWKGMLNAAGNLITGEEVWPAFNALPEAERERLVKECAFPVELPPTLLGLSWSMLCEQHTECCKQLLVKLGLMQ